MLKEKKIGHHWGLFTNQYESWFLPVDLTNTKEEGGKFNNVSSKIGKKESEKNPIVDSDVIEGTKGIKIQIFNSNDMIVYNITTLQSKYVGFCTVK